MDNPIYSGVGDMRILQGDTIERRIYDLQSYDWGQSRSDENA